jgi:hypothetical protein
MCKCYSKMCHPQTELPDSRGPESTQGEAYLILDLTTEF